MANIPVADVNFLLYCPVHKFCFDINDFLWFRISIRYSCNPFYRHISDGSYYGQNTNQYVNYYTR